MCPTEWMMVENWEMVSSVVDQHEFQYEILVCITADVCLWYTEVCLLVCLLLSVKNCS